MSIEKLTYQTIVTVREVISGVDLTSQALSRNQYNTLHELTEDTTPPVSKHAAGVKEFTDTGTLDLTALDNGPLQDQDMTDLRIQVAKFVNPEDNTSAITLSDGASNGYWLMGDSWTVTLHPGQEVVFYGNNATPFVSSTRKTIDLVAGDGTGTGTSPGGAQEIQYSISAGAD